MNPPFPSDPSSRQPARTPADLLLVEDDGRLLELLTWFLERLGHAVRGARDFGQARTLLAERRPDLMLSDVRVGATLASEELPKLAADGLLPPTLIVSGYLDGTLRQELERLPAVRGMLRKPFEMPALASAVDGVLATLGDGFSP